MDCSILEIGMAATDLDFIPIGPTPLVIWRGHGQRNADYRNHERDHGPEDRTLPEEGLHDGDDHAGVRLHWDSDSHRL